jgi:hypothetical protein
VSSRWHWQRGERETTVGLAGETAFDQDLPPSATHQSSAPQHQVCVHFTASSHLRTSNS